MVEGLSVATAGGIACQALMSGHIGGDSSRRVWRMEAEYGVHR